MAAAGYDPAEAPRFWERMRQVGGGKQPEFMSTHPSHESRSRDLQGWLNEAMPFYASSQKQNGSRLLPRH
jgi:predicted Zn-dependent protease